MTNGHKNPITIKNTSRFWFNIFYLNRLDTRIFCPNNIFDNRIVLYWYFWIIFFTYFYTLNVAFKPDEVADNLKKQGGFVPGIRPGERTSKYLEYVVVRTLVLGSGYLAAICLLPEVLRSQFAIPFYFGGTSLLIVVSVTMDTITQIQSHMLAYQYEGLIERSKIRGSSKRNKKGRRWRI